ncbi:hypothetical protein D3C85_1202120 [compost metagenome]
MIESAQLLRLVIRVNDVHHVGGLRVVELKYLVAGEWRHQLKRLAHIRAAAVKHQAAIAVQPHLQVREFQRIRVAHVELEADHAGHFVVRRLRQESSARPVHDPAVWADHEVDALRQTSLVCGDISARSQFRPELATGERRLNERCGHACISVS